MEYTKQELSWLKQHKIKHLKIQQDRIRFEIKIQSDLIDYLSPNEFGKYPTSKEDLEFHILFKEELEKDLRKLNTSKIPPPFKGKSNTKRHFDLNR